LLPKFIQNQQEETNKQRVKLHETKNIDLYLKNLTTGERKMFTQSKDTLSNDEIFDEIMICVNQR